MVTGRNKCWIRWKNIDLWNPIVYAICHHFLIETIQSLLYNLKIPNRSAMILELFDTYYDYSRLMGYELKFLKVIIQDFFEIDVMQIASI
jgi:hypothetical protein